MVSIAASLQEGLRRHQAGQLEQAERLYREVLRTDPRQADALHLLGMAAQGRGRRDEALDLVGRAIRSNPSEPMFHANLGAILESLDRPADAEAAYRRALGLDPQHTTALNNLGNLHRAAFRLEEASGYYRSAIDLRPDFAAAHSNLGATFADQRRFDDAIACYRRALDIDVSFHDARKNLGIALAEQGRYGEASAELAAARALAPDDAGLKIRSALLLPVIAESADAIDARRKSLSDDVDRLIAEDLAIHDPVAETPGPAFYLAYHGRNDRALQMKIAALYARAVPSLDFVAPHCRRRRTPVRRADAPIRVGLISRFFHEHSIADHYAGLVRSFPRVSARYTVFRFPGPTDEIARDIEQAADAVVTLSPQIAEAREQVAARELDVLLYTDIGMDPWTYFLAFARLAPVQCVTVGQPETTGIPTIDYFLSHDLLEPTDAADHYSERLVLLRNMPNFFVRPLPRGPEKDRSDFPIPGDARWYVCPQTLFKLHPDFDRLLAGVLRSDPRGLAIFFEGQTPHWTELVRGRFERTMPDVVDRVVFLPRLSFDDYLQFLLLADVLLDTVHFTGGTTALHAHALGVPMVTLPARFARGRGTYATYRRIGVDDCVAVDSEDYVRRAILIAGDRTHRESIRSRILERSGILFSNPAAAAELETFFVEAAIHAKARRR